MRLMLVTGAVETAVDISAFQLRNGLPPTVPDRQLIASSWLSVVGSSSRSSNLSVSPDAQWVAQLATNTTINIWRFLQGQDLESNIFERLEPEIYPVAASVCEISNNYCVVGGSGTRRLMIYSLPTLEAVQGVDMTGLGDVTAVAFSPDGTKLAVCHSTSPHLRVYNTLDWSYVGAATTAGSSRYAVCFTGDGTRVVTCGSSSPFLTVHSADLATRYFANTSSVNGCNTASGAYPSMLADPLRPTEVLRTAGGSTSSRNSIIKIDAITGVVTTVLASPGISTSQMMIDPIERKLYCSTNLSDGTYLHAINLDTLEDDTSVRFHGVGRQFYGANAQMAYFSRSVYRISGTVRDINNQPVQREVRAYRRKDGLIMAKVMSNASTGNYSLLVPDAGPYDIQFLTLPGETLNDLFYARTTPELVSP